MAPESQIANAALSRKAEEIVEQLARGKVATKKRCKELAREIMRRRDSSCVVALIELLQNEPTAESAARVLQECGESAPAMLVPYADTFLELLNRGEGWVVRSAMDSLAWVCQVQPDALWSRREELFSAFEDGTDQTRDSAVAILTTLAGSSPTRRGHLSPMLLELLRECGRKALPVWAEQVMPVLSGQARAQAERVLAKRLDELKPSGRQRVERLLKLPISMSGSRRNRGRPR
jgi:hypothetical protein